MYYFSHLSGHAPKPVRPARDIDAVYGMGLSGSRWESLYSLLATAARIMSDSSYIGVVVLHA